MDRLVELQGVDVMHIVDGLPVDNTINDDRLGHRQIGLLPRTVSRAVIAGTYRLA